MAIHIGLKEVTATLGRTALACSLASVRPPMPASTTQ